jgi:hypothetical protein
MSGQTGRDLKLEIAHVLFIDIVGYSKLLHNEQSEVLRELNEIVRNTEQFRAADAAGALLRLPTGDGVALIFRNSPEAPGPMRAGDRGGIEESFAYPASNGNSQRSGERSCRRERARQFRRRRHQHRAAGDGLRRRWSTFC